MQVRVITNQDEQIIDNVSSIEQVLGERTPLANLCGGGLDILCPDCKQNNIGPCGQRFFVGYRQGQPKALWITNSEREFIFVGDDVKFEILDAPDS